MWIIYNVICIILMGIGGVALYFVMKPQFDEIEEEVQRIREIERGLWD